MPKENIKRPKTHAINAGKASQLICIIITNK